VKGVKYHISALVEKGRGEKYRRNFHHGSHLGQILGTDDFADIALKISNQGMNKPKGVKYHILALRRKEDQKPIISECLIGNPYQIMDPR